MLEKVGALEIFVMLIFSTKSLLKLLVLFLLVWVLLCCNIVHDGMALTECLVVWGLEIDLFPFLSGQFICGNKHCDVKDGLASYEASVYTSSNKFNSIIVWMLVNGLSIITSCSLNLATVSFLCMIFAFRCLQVNFSYFEAGENKQALVKLILCDRWVGYL
jgi:hypothetical protein